MHQNLTSGRKNKIKSLELNRREARKLLAWAADFQGYALPKDEDIRFDVFWTAQELASPCRRLLDTGEPVVLGGYQIGSAFVVATDYWAHLARNRRTEEVRRCKPLIYVFDHVLAVGTDKEDL